MASTTFSGPVTSTAGFISGSDSLVSVAADVTLTCRQRRPHNGLGRNERCDCYSSGGERNRQHLQVFVATTVTSNSYKIQVANGDDTMAGVAIVANDGGDTASIFETAATSDTITLNGTTTGGILGGTN